MPHRIWLITKSNPMWRFLRNLKLLLFLPIFYWLSSYLHKGLGDGHLLDKTPQIPHLSKQELLPVLLVCKMQYLCAANLVMKIWEWIYTKYEVHFSCYKCNIDGFLINLLSEYCGFCLSTLFWIIQVHHKACGFNKSTFISETRET